MPFVRTDDGVDIHYEIDDFRDPWRQDDDGSAVFLHHGFCRNLKWWTQWVPRLSREYRVVRYDCRGCGESSIPGDDAEWSAARIASDVVALIDHLGILKIHWVGFESGGIFGIVFATSHPDRTSSLTLVNTPYKILDAPMSLYTQGRPSASDAVITLGFRQWLVQTMPNRLDMRLVSQELLDWHIDEQSKTHPQVVYRLLHDVVESADVSGLLPSISVPTLLMTGDRSANSPLDDQAFLLSQISDARMVVFPDIGPGIQVLMPDRCVDEQLSFLRSLNVGLAP
jgi:3-oxoadipate enol-lactonase